MKKARTKSSSPNDFEWKYCSKICNEISETQLGNNALVFWNSNFAFVSALENNSTSCLCAYTVDVWECRCKWLGGTNFMTADSVYTKQDGRKCTCLQAGSQIWWKRSEKSCKNSISRWKNVFTNVFASDSEKCAENGARDRLIQTGWTVSCHADSESSKSSLLVVVLQNSSRTLSWEHSVRRLHDSRRLLLLLSIMVLWRISIWDTVSKSLEVYGSWASPESLLDRPNGSAVINEYDKTTGDVKAHGLPIACLVCALSTLARTNIQSISSTDSALLSGSF